MKHSFSCYEKLLWEMKAGRLLVEHKGCTSRLGKRNCQSRWWHNKADGIFCFARYFGLYRTVCSEMIATQDNKAVQSIE